ncbi:MAG: hypothetical protein ABI315_04320 [Bacteroidia bacterium]
MENYQIITLQISDIRLILNRVELKKPDDRSILNAFENLATFVITNFEIPSSHKEYMYENLGIENSVLNIVDELIKNNSEIREHFDIQFKLRAIESYFSWGRPENIELPQLITLKYLIAKLHSLIGDKTVKSVVNQEVNLRT